MIKHIAICLAIYTSNAEVDVNSYLPTTLESGVYVEIIQSL